MLNSVDKYGHNNYYTYINNEETKMNYTKREALKEIRAAAKSVGLTFKQSSTRLNGAHLWKLVDRKSGESVITNYLFSSA